MPLNSVRQTSRALPARKTLRVALGCLSVRLHGIASHLNNNDKRFYAAGTTPIEAALHPTQYVTVIHFRLRAPPQSRAGLSPLAFSARTEAPAPPDCAFPSSSIFTDREDIVSKQVHHTFKDPVCVSGGQALKTDDCTRRRTRGVIWMERVKGLTRSSLPLRQ